MYEVVDGTIRLGRDRAIVRPCPLVVLSPVLSRQTSRWRLPLVFGRSYEELAVHVLDYGKLAMLCSDKLLVVPEHRLVLDVPVLWEEHLPFVLRIVDALE